MGYKPNINDVLDRWEEMLKEQYLLYQETGGSNLSFEEFDKKNQKLYKLNKVIPSKTEMIKVVRSIVN